MENVWVLAALWVGLALIATLLGIWLKISAAPTEIVGGTVAAQFIIGAFVGYGTGIGAKTGWMSFLAGTGAIVLTFLAGAELYPTIFRTKWKEDTARSWIATILRNKMENLMGDLQALIRKRGWKHRSEESGQESDSVSRARQLLLGTTLVRDQQ